LPKWRLYIGFGLLSFALILPLSALLVPLLGLHPAVTAIIMAIVLFGGPELAALLALPFLGRETYDYIKAEAYDWVKKRAGLKTPR
jgi:hypothetical protein